MRFRKYLLLVGCVSLFAIVGLVVILLGLTVGYRAVAHSPPTPTPTKTPRPPLTAPSMPTLVVMAATPLPTDALSPSSVAPSVSTDSSVDTPISSDTTVSSPADTQAGGPMPTEALTGTSVPSPTLAPTLTGELAPTPTISPLSPGRITGRLLVDGAPVGEGVALKLEDPSYNVIAETTVGADGAYAFPDLEPSSGGYNVLFAQEWNSQYGTDQVVSWGWLGSVAVEDGVIVELPECDVSLLGFKQVNPEADATFSAAAISSENPITFEWRAYPQAVKYWVDLVRGEEQQVVWQSSLIQATSLTFDGTVDNGTHIQPGEYWWGVGALRDLGPYRLIVYGYLPGLIIEP